MVRCLMWRESRVGHVWKKDSAKILGWRLSWVLLSLEACREMQLMEVMFIALLSTLQHMAFLREVTMVVVSLSESVCYALSFFCLLRRLSRMALLRL